MDGDAWVNCRCGMRHWGRYGAAGLFVLDPTGQRVVMQHRAPWTHLGGHWGIPGGARASTESASAGALREAHEEAAIDERQVLVRASYLLDHTDWSYTTVLAQALEDFTPVVSDPESTSLQWVDLSDVPALALLPAFATAWPTLELMAGARPAIVIDAANVVGSRPNGWWKDRAAAAKRLIADLDQLSREGIAAKELELAGHRWWPKIYVVTEGVAARTEIVPADPHVTVIRAGKDGDSRILELLDSLAAAPPAQVPQPPNQFYLVSSDRQLREFTTAKGATVFGVSWLWRLIEAASGA